MRSITIKKFGYVPDRNWFSYAHNEACKGIMGNMAAEQIRSKVVKEWAHSTEGFSASQFGTFFPFALMHIVDEEFKAHGRQNMVLDCSRWLY
jgi:hypothetical protein